MGELRNKVCGVNMQLTRYDTARKALAEAHHVDEVKNIRDKAEAMAAYARQAKDTDLVQWATEIKVRAERKCGELLRNSNKPKGGRPSKNRSHDVTGFENSAQTLSEIGISKNDSSRWQKLADMPEEHFETAVATAKEHTGQVTTAHMLRVANEVNEPKAAGQPAAQTNSSGVVVTSARTLAARAISAIQQIQKNDPNAPAAIRRIRAALDHQNELIITGEQ